MAVHSWNGGRPRTNVRPERLATARRGSAVALLVALGSVATSADAQVQTVGPGLFSTATATAIDSGERTNVSDGPAAVTTLTPAGTYDVTSFFYDRGANTAGEVSPFLARLTATNQYQVVWAGAPVPAAGVSTKTTGAPESRFTLGTATTLYAGFTTTNGGRVLLVNGAGTTDHSATAVTVSAGSNLTTFSNPDLPRAYRQAIAFQPAAGISIPIGPGITSRTGTDGGERLNVDQLYSRKFTAGSYTINNLSYYSSSVAGQVTPFLVTAGAADNNWTYLWIGAATTPGKIGDVSIPLNTTLSLGADTQVYAGFFTADGGRVGFDQNSNAFAYGLTDHTTFTNPLFPPAPGDPLGGFSNADLARRYDFSIGILNPNPFVPEPATAGLLGLGAVGLCFRRRRRA